MLNAEELKQAQRLISAAAPGVYELKTLFGAEWSAVASPTSFGKRFRQAVLARQLKNICPDSTRGDNHKLYQVG